jgi:hypothetical protein
MNTLRLIVTRSLPLVLALICFTATASVALGQTDTKPAPENKRYEEINLDTQLYMIVGSNQEGTEDRFPASLEPVIKELHASLPFKNYRLSATLLNRVKSDGHLDLHWIGGPVIERAASTTATPSFSDFFVRQVRLWQNVQGQDVINMDGFRFGSRIPIQTSAAVAANGNTVPSITYEQTGLNTDISMREGVPVIVGTLNAGPSGDAIILVVSARRSRP